MANTALLFSATLGKCSLCNHVFIDGKSADIPVCWSVAGRCQGDGEVWRTVVLHPGSRAWWYRPDPLRDDY